MFSRKQLSFGILAAFILSGFFVPNTQAVDPVVFISNLQPDFAAVGGGGVFSAYIGPPAYGFVSPGTTAIFDSREAGIIKAGFNTAPANDEGLFAFKPTVTIDVFATGALTYDVQNQFGVNPVWMTIEVDTGDVDVAGVRIGNTAYQFVPTSNPAGWNTFNAGAGLWLQWTTTTSGITVGEPMTLSAIASVNTGRNVVRTYLRLGMGESYYNGGTGTTAWVDKATIGGVKYDFVTPVCDLANSFDSFTLGSVNGQGGWSEVNSTYDQAVVANTYGYSTFGCKSLRVSDGVTSGAFDWIFSPSVTNEAGESAAVSGGFSSGTRQNHFEAQFDVASVLANVQPGLHVSVSPDRGDGSRMSYLRFEDQEDGIHVFFVDVTDVGPLGMVATFNETAIATISRAPHTAKFVVDLVDGPGNDIVKIYIDGTLEITGTSWEDYYRFDPEQTPAGNQVPTIDSLIVQARGSAAPANTGNGFLFDNFSFLSGPTPPGPVFNDQNENHILDVGEVTYPTIQTAVDAALSGATIQVTAGTYPEHVTVNKSLTLNGANRGVAGNGVRGPESIVDGTDAGTPFAITANDVTINGFTIENGSNGGLFSGIWSQTGTLNSSILNNIITQNGFGVWAQCGGNCLIQANLFDSNNKPNSPGSGDISADSTSGLTIDNNEFKNDTAGNPILLQAVGAGAHTGVAVSNNNFHNNAFSNIYALGVTGGTFTGNTITPASDATGISFSGLDTNITVTNNVITGGARGVRVEDAGYYGEGLGGNSNITVNGNSVASDSTYGLGNISGYTGNVDATCNWWGAANGPGSVGPGSGSLVTTGVTFTPWLTSTNLNGVCNGSTFTLTYSAGANGTLTGDTPQTVSFGDNGTAVTAVPDTGYHFVNWSDLSTTNPRTDTNVTANLSVTANFAINTYTLTYAAGANGTLTGSTSQTVDHGANGTAVTAVPDTGYHFVNWSDLSTTNPRTDTNVTANLSVTANFAINQYTITFDSAGGSAVAAITQDYGSAVTAPSAPTKSGYTFAGWLPAVPATMPLNGASLTAQWTSNSQGGSRRATPAVPANVTTPDGCLPGAKFSITTNRNCNAATPAVPAGQVLGASTVLGDPANLAKYGLKEGDLIGAVDFGDSDVYIVNAQGYKRLFLNPVIFSFYGHLGGFSKVKHVSIAARDAFPTSGLFQNCEGSDLKVYGVEVTGEDIGIFHWMNMSGAQAASQDSEFFKKVFCINTQESNWYAKSSTDFTAVANLPAYKR